MANLSLVHTVLQQEDGGQNAGQKKYAVHKRKVRVRKKKCAGARMSCTTGLSLGSLYARLRESNI